MTSALISLVHSKPETGLHEASNPFDKLQTLEKEKSRIETPVVAIIEDEEHEKRESLPKNQNKREEDSRKTRRRSRKKVFKDRESIEFDRVEKNCTDDKITNVKTTPTRKPFEPLRIDINANVPLVTPTEVNELSQENVITTNKPVRRSLVPRTVSSDSKDSSDSSVPALIEETSEHCDNLYAKEKKPSQKMRRIISHTKIRPSVKKVYHVINKITGSLGGNGSGGAIYGELSIGSMQKMVDLMKKHTGFNEKSRFIDVGCGLAKPNIHVAQDPGVEFSYGIEMEKVRWLLGMHNLNQVLKAAEPPINKKSKDTYELGHRVFIAHGNIKQAKTFDPFTHVYMFDIGFPPTLFHVLSKMYNTSQSEYLICFHGPRLIIERYNFNVEFVTRTPTSMHGSAENHMGYIYKRSVKSTLQKGRKSTTQNNVPCDDLFLEAWQCVQGGYSSVSKHVKLQLQEEMNSSSIAKRTRSATTKKTSIKQ